MQRDLSHVNVMFVSFQGYSDIRESSLLLKMEIWYWYSPATFHHNVSLHVCAVLFQWRLLIFIGKNLWPIVLETNKKQVSPKSYSLKIRIDSVNQILKNKEKELRKPVTQMYWPELQAGWFLVYILLSII